MSLPNILTLARIGLAPVLFVFIWLPEWTGQGQVAFTAIALGIFLVSELTDLLDGMLARRNNQVSELGKLLDPFSDVISRITCFISFVALGLLHPALCLILLYREFSIVFVRMILAQRGTTLAASSGGKLKSLLYFFSCLSGLILLLLLRSGTGPDVSGAAGIVTTALFVASSILAVWSLVAYLRVFVQKLREKSKTSS